MNNIRNHAAVSRGTLAGMLGGILWIACLAAGAQTPAVASSTASSAGPADQTASFAAVIDSPIRTEDDHKADDRRKPADFLRFAQIKPGMNVLDVSAGAGYTTQLLALAVGPTGNVWAQSPKASAKMEKRLSAHPQANIHPLVRSFEDPYPADAPRLDLITFVLNYHDVANEPVDRAKMDKHLLEALKPGGHMILIDHAAQRGSGLRDTNTLHRIDEETVVSELEHAGFKVEARSDFLQNKADPRTEAFFDYKGQSDRFALRLVRP